MLQIKKIENNNKLFKFINLLLNEMDKKGEREMVIVFENGKFSDKLENGREVEFYE